MRWLNVGSSCTKPANCVYSPNPNKYNPSSATLHTTKLATARGMRSLSSGVSNGSKRNAMVMATTMVMKKTRP